MMKLTKTIFCFGAVLLSSMIVTNGNAYAAHPVHSMATATSAIAPGHIQSKPNDDADINISTPFLSAPSVRDTDAALVFVRQTGLNKNLSLMLLEAMKNDTIVLSAIRDKGFKIVQRIVVDEIKVERAAHEEAWSHMLADIYSKHFSTSELTSLTKHKEKSPYFSRLIALQNQITASIHEHGSSLLTVAERNLKNRLTVALGT